MVRFETKGLHKLSVEGISHYGTLEIGLYITDITQGH